MEIKHVLCSFFLSCSLVINAQPVCDCYGQGTTTLVMEAGMGGWSVWFQPLRTQLDSNYRVCLLSRSGYLTPAATQNKTPHAIAQEMYQVIRDAGIRDSVILVGHSFGGLNVRIFQSMYPELVKGMVLLDASHPDQFQQLPAEFEALKNTQADQMLKVEAIARKGYLRYSKKSIPTFGLPEPWLDEYYRITTTPHYYANYRQEVLAFDSSLAAVHKLSEPLSIPLLVLSARNSMDKTTLPGKQKKYPFEAHNLIWLNLQQELARISPNSRWIVLDGIIIF